MFLIKVYVISFENRVLKWIDLQFKTVIFIQISSERSRSAVDNPSLAICKEKNDNECLVNFHCVQNNPRKSEVKTNCSISNTVKRMNTITELYNLMKSNSVSL